LETVVYSSGANISQTLGRVVLWPYRYLHLFLNNLHTMR